MECELNLRFKIFRPKTKRKAPHKPSRTYARVQLTNPKFTILEADTLTAPLPLERIIPDVPGLIKKLKTGFVFEQVDGYIQNIRFEPTEGLWLKNLKRGIANLFTMNIVGKKDLKTVFKSLERTIFGRCECNYNQNDTLSHLERENKHIRIIKTIDADRCRYPLSVNMATVSSIFGTEPTEKIHHTLATLDINILRTQSNWKLLSARSNSTIMFYPLGENNMPMLTTAYQRLMLIREKNSKMIVVIPPKWPKLKLDMEVPKMIEATRKEMTIPKIAEFIYKSLLTLSKKMENETTTYVEETTKEMTEMVQILRSVNTEGLLVIWDRCVKTDDKLTTLFLRILSMVRTEPSMNVLLDQRLRTLINHNIPTEVIKEVLLMQSTPLKPNIKMIIFLEGVCENPLIKNDAELQSACFLTLVTVRRNVCLGIWGSCRRPLPIEFTKVLKPTKFITLEPEEMLRNILIAEAASDPSLLTPIMNIVRTKFDIPQFIRIRAVRALRPIAHKIGLKVTNEVLKLLINEPLCNALRLQLYSILLERPTPSIIHACVNRVMTNEKCMIAKRFVYETLLAYAVKKDLNLPEETRKACQFAVQQLRLKHLVPLKTRTTPTQFMEIIKPFTNANLQMTMKKQIHYSSDSSFPKQVDTTLHVDLFGKRFNLMDLTVAVNGIQELFAKFSKATSETEPQVELTTLASLNFLDHPVLSTFKRVIRKEPTTILEKSSTSFWTWSKVAEEINKNLNIDAKKTLMPVEVILRLPTPIGLPLTYHLQTVVMYELKASLNTETPTLFDLPRLAFTDAEMKVTTVLKHRSLMTIIGTVKVDTPIATLGIQHTSFTKTLLNNNMVMTINPKTMQVDSDLKLSKIPEILSTTCETELFVRCKLLKIERRAIPTLIENILPKMWILGQPDLESKNLHATINLKVGDEYISTEGDRVVLSNNPTEWVIIPAPGNSRIISLYLPNRGYLVVERITRKLKISPVKPEYFITDQAKDGIMLKTLIPIELKELKRDGEIEALLTPVMEFVSMLRKEGIVTSLMQRAIRWRDVDPLKAVQVMWIKMENKSFVMVDNPESAITIKRVTVKCATTRITEEARSHGICLKHQLPYLPVCLRGLIPKTPTVDIKTLMYPMFLDIALPNELTNIKTTHSLKNEEEITTHTIKMTPVGLKPTRDLEIKMMTETKEPRYALTIRSITGVNRDDDHVICGEWKSVNDSITGMLSMHPRCVVKHVEVFTTLDEQTLTEMPRLEMRFKWILRVDTLPMHGKRLMVLFVENILLPLIPTAIERIPIKSKFLRLINTNTNVNGTLRMSLITDDLLKVAVNSPQLLPLELRLPMLSIIDSFPIGRKNLPLHGRLLEQVNKRLCKHSLNTFTTFDGLTYKHDIETPNCEQVLVQTRKYMKPMVKITVKKQQPNLRIVRMNIDESIIEVIPKTNATLIPTIKINGRQVPLFTDTFEIELTEGHMLRGVWIPEEKSLNLRHLGISFTMVSERTIYNRMSPLLYHGRVSGLCGNMDSERHNEFETPEGLVVKDRHLFWLTWIIPGKYCSKTGCPFKRNEVPKIQPKRCVPAIGLPSCMCSTKKSITVNEVPMKCPGIPKPIYKPFTIPVQCSCDCQ